MVTGYRYHMHVHDEYVLDSLLPYIFLQPYQCSQSRNIESPRQGVRGSESFRVIHSSGIPLPFGSEYIIRFTLRLIIFS